MALGKALGGSTALTVKDEGVTLSSAVTSIDTVGSGVTATNIGGAVTLTIPGSSGAEVLIDRQTPSGTGTVTFSSLGSYSDLRVVVVGRGTVAATATNIRLQFNSDSGGNYDWEINEISGSATNAIGQNFAQTSLHIGYLAGSTATANVADSCEARIMDYRGTTFEKVIRSHSAAKTSTASGGLVLSLFAGFYRSTSAITRVDVSLASGNFSSGSVVALYGIS